MNDDKDKIFPFKKGVAYMNVTFVLKSVADMVENIFYSNQIFYLDKNLHWKHVKTDTLIEEFTKTLSVDYKLEKLKFTPIIINQKNNKSKK